MIPAIGARRIASRNRTPVTTDAKPVLAPSATPAALSMYVVFEETPASPPTAAAMLSTMRTRPTPGTEPSSRASPASAATPVTVPIVSKKSVSMIAKITRIAVRSGRVLKTLPRSNDPRVEKFGVSASLSGIFVTPAARATSVVPRIEMTRAARIRRAHRIDRECEAEEEDELCGRRRKRYRHERAGADRKWHERRAARLDKAAVGKADEQDEEADAGADRPLEGQRHGVHDGFAEADQDEDRDREAFEDDDAHRAGRREAPAGEAERNDGVDAEPGGQGERVVRPGPMAMVMMPAIRAVPAKGRCGRGRPLRA